MKEYTVRILDVVFADINDIADFIVEVSTPEHAARYARELQAEIMTLRYLAGIIPESRYRSVRHYHPHAKQLRKEVKGGVKKEVKVEVKRDNTFVDNVVDITFVQFDVSPLDFLNLFNFHFNFILFNL